MRKLFGTKDIRGVANEELTPEFCVRLGKAVGTYFGGGDILVGMDERLGSQMTALALMSGLISTGCRVHWLGLATTPMVQWAVGELGGDGGIVITASHNPPEYTGIIVLDEHGIEVSPEAREEIEAIFRGEEFMKVPWYGLRPVREVDTEREVLKPYIKSVIRQVDVNLIELANPKIIIDTASTVSAMPIHLLMEELGISYVMLGAELDGRHPRRISEPRPDTLSRLRTVASRLEADFGVGVDGDCNRAIFCYKDEVWWGDYSFALIAKWYLRDHPGETLLTPISSSMVVKDVVEACGGKLKWCKVGAGYVSRIMVEEGIRLAGEENGGICYAYHGPFRDACMAIALMLQVLAEEGRPLKELMDELPRYQIAKGSVPCPEELKEKVMSEVGRRVEGEAYLEKITIDGIRLMFEGYSVLIRPSGTEPIIRVFTESRHGDAEELLAKYMGLVEEVVGEVSK